MKMKTSTAHKERRANRAAVAQLVEQWCVNPIPTMSKLMPFSTHTFTIYRMLAIDHQHCWLIIWISHFCFMCVCLFFFFSFIRLNSVLHWNCAPPLLQSAAHYAKRLHRWVNSISSADVHKHCEQAGTSFSEVWRCGFTRTTVCRARRHT